MISPPGWDGAVFSEAGDGDVRRDQAERSRLIRRAGAPEQWAIGRQVHGADVVAVTAPGDAGEADALWTAERRLAVAVFTADCFGVVVHAEAAVGVAHAGWRGAAAGVVSRLVDAMTGAGHAPQRAAVGPGIGPCCFEVGPEVVSRFPGHASTTSWSTESVDLPGAVGEQLEGLDVWWSGACTHHDPGLFSHRRDSTSDRLAAVGWIP